MYHFNLIFSSLLSIGNQTRHLKWETSTCVKLTLSMHSIFVTYPTNHTIVKPCVYIATTVKTSSSCLSSHDEDVNTFQFQQATIFTATLLFQPHLIIVVGLMDRELDSKPEVTQGCGFESRLRQEVHDCSPGAAQSAAHCSKCVHLDGLNAENTFHSSLYSV